MSGTNRKGMRFALTALSVLLLVALCLGAAACQTTEEDGDKVQVLFMNGTTEHYATLVSVGDALQMPNPPRRNSDGQYDYQFLGWTRSETNTVVDDAASAPQLVEAGLRVEANLTLYAVFLRTPKAVVSRYRVDWYDSPDFGGTFLKSDTVDAGSAATPPTPPTHTGYTFTGWGDAPYQAVEEDLTVYAQYRVNTHHVYLHDLGDVTGREVAYGASLALDTDLTGPHEMFRFKGWYYDEQGDDRRVTGDSIAAMPDEDVHVYAHYSIDMAGRINFVKSGDWTYGGSEDAVEVTLPYVSDLTYTYAWADGSTGSRATFKNAGTHTVVVDVTANYKNGLVVDVYHAQGEDVTVAKAPLQARLSMQQAQLTYGTLPQPNLTYDGFQYGETAGSLGFAPTFTYAPAAGESPADAARLPVGTYTVSAAQSQPDNYTLSPIDPTSLEVLPAQVTVSVQIAPTCVYGEALAPKLIAEGMQYGEAPEVLGTPTFTYTTDVGAPQAADARFPVGTYHVSVAPLTATNYTVTIRAQAAQFEVQPRAVTVDVDVNGSRATADVTYGTAVTFSVRQTGMVADEAATFAERFTFTYTLNEGEGQQSGVLPAGSYTVYAAATKSDSNYTLRINSRTFTVSPKPLTLGVTMKKSKFIYGPEADVLAQCSVDALGLVNEDTFESVFGGYAESNFTFLRGVEPYSDTTRFAAGAYTVQVRTVTSQNYTITYRDPVEFSVSKAVLTVTLTPTAQTYTYGDQPGVTYAWGARAFGEDVSTALTSYCPVYKRNGEQNITGETYPAGSYTVSLAYESDNYDVTVTPGSFTIDPYALQVTFTASTEACAYGDSVSLNSSVPALKYGEQIGVLGNLRTVWRPQGGGERVYENGDRLPVGSYVADLIGLTNSNYTFSVEKCTLVVSKRALQVTVRGGSESISYGKPPAYALSASNLVGGDTLEGVFGANLVRYYPADGGPAVDLTSAPLPVGSYTVKIFEGAESANYTVEEQQEALEVTPYVFCIAPRATTINAQRTFTFAPAFEGEDATLFTFRGTVKLDCHEHGSYTATNADEFRENHFVWEQGRWSVVLTRTETDVSANFTLKYNLSVTLAEYNFDIVLPSDTTRPYDAQPHTFEVQASVLEEEDASEEVVTVQYSYPGSSGFVPQAPSFTEAGEYVVQYQVSAASVVGVQKGQFTVHITQADNAIDLAALGELDRVYDGQDHVYDFSALRDSFDNRPAVTATAFSLSDGKATLKNAGDYTVHLQIEETKNFKGVSQDVTVHIDRAQYGISEQVDQNVTYDARGHGGSVQVSALPGERYTLTYTYPDYSGADAPVAAFVNAATYTVQYTVSGNDNYQDVSGSFTLTIAKATPTYETQAAAFTYDGTQQGSGILRVNGVGSGEVPKVEYGTELGTYGDSEPVFKDAGEHTVYFCITGANYETVTGQYGVNIARKVLVVTMPAAEQVTYDGSLHGGTVSVTGAVDDGYTVRYSYNDEGGTQQNSKETAPQFQQAGTYTVRVDLAGDNYAFAADAQGTPLNSTYTIVIARAKGELTLKEGAQTHFVYNTRQQKVTLDSSILGGNLLGTATASSLKYALVSGTGTLSGKEYTFTTVAEGNATLRVSLTGHRNYTDASLDVTLTMDKATYGETLALPGQANQSYTMSMTYPTLSRITLDPGWLWVTPTDTLKVGTNRYNAKYNADPDNYHDKVVSLSLTGVKDKVIASVTANQDNVGLNKGYNAAKMTLTLDSTHTAITETSPEWAYVKTSVSGSVNPAVGGTYVLTYDPQFVENDYFTLEVDGHEMKAGDKIYRYVKVVSVKVGGTDYTLEDALNRAQSGDIVRVSAGSTTSMTEADRAKVGLYNTDAYYTVKSGVTLLVPYGDDDTSANTKVVDQTNHAAITKAYSTLVLGKNLTVQGVLVVNGIRTSTGGVTSCVTGGKFGQMEVLSGVTITFKNGSVYESIGFTYGAGLMVAESGAKVYETFNMYGWKGGAISAGIRNTVFPLSQFTLNSIICKIRFQTGSAYYAKAALTASNVPVDTDVEVLSNSSNAFLQLTSGYLEKWVVESNGRWNLDIYGDLTVNNIEVVVKFKIPILGELTEKINTADTQVPLPGHVTITVSSGKVTIPSTVKVKLLPGAQLDVKQGAELVVDGEAYAYGAGNYTCAKSDGSSTTFQDGFKAYPYGEGPNTYRVKPTLDYTANTPAVVRVAGKVTVNGKAAAVFTGEAGGQIVLGSKAVLSGSLKEDSSASGSIGQVEALLGNAGEFYTTTFSTKGAGGEAFTAGNTYTHNGSAWA